MSWFERLMCKFYYALNMVNAYLACHRDDECQGYLNAANRYADRLQLDDFHRRFV